MKNKLNSFIQDLNEKKGFNSEESFLYWTNIYLRFKCLYYNRQSWFVRFEYHPSTGLYSYHYEACLNNFNKDNIISPMIKSFLHNYNYQLTAKNLECFVRKESDLPNVLVDEERYLVDLFRNSLSNEQVIIFFKSH